MGRGTLAGQDSSMEFIHRFTTLRFQLTPTVRFLDSFPFSFGISEAFLSHPVPVALCQLVANTRLSCLLSIIAQQAGSPQRSLLAALVHQLEGLRTGLQWHPAPLSLSCQDPAAV